jgi:hypothetical protein
MATALEKVLKRTYRLVKDKGGIFGINVMVSAELKQYSQIMIDTAIRVREENPDMKNNFKVILTSAGDPVGWKDKIKGAGFTGCTSYPPSRAPCVAEGRRGRHRSVGSRGWFSHLLGTGPFHDPPARGR